MLEHITIREDKNCLYDYDSDIGIDHIEDECDLRPSHIARGRWFTMANQTKHIKYKNCHKHIVFQDNYD